MISSPTNERIKEARKLHRRRQRYAIGRVLIEGVRLVQDAVSAGVRPVEVFYAPELLTGPGADSLLATLRKSGVPLWACTVAVFATLAETVTPQGIAAVIPMPVAVPPAEPSLVLVLDRVREPGNAGTLLRSAEAAGVDLVVLAPETVDPFNDKVLRSGMGAHFRLPLVLCQTWEEVTVYLHSSKGAMACFLAEAGAPHSYEAVDWTQPAALIVGGEAEGARSAARALATPIAIPMAGQTESLNAAVAGAVILFEAARQRRQAKVVR